MRPITDRFRDAIANTHQARVREITVTQPGSSTPVPLDIDAGSVTLSDVGARYTATLSLSPMPGTDVHALVSTPGALFTIRAGISYGAGQSELIDLGVYEATQGNNPLTVGEVPLTLVDQTTRLARCRFTAPWVVSGGTRADAIEAMVTDAIATATVIKLADGGTMPAAMFDRDRLQAIADLAKDGNLDVGFDALGRYVIRAQPALTPTAPVWTARTGNAANIIDASHDHPFDRLYNTVVVIPVDDTQLWSVQTVSVSDPAHPRHPDKVGVVPYFHTSPMITTAAQAVAAGEGILQRLLTTTDHIKATVLGNPALEYGDTLAVVHEATGSDPGLSGTYLLEDFTFDLVSGAQEITARSTDLAELAES